MVCGYFEARGCAIDFGVEGLRGISLFLRYDGRVVMAMGGADNRKTVIIDAV